MKFNNQYEINSFYAAYAHARMNEKHYFKWGGSTYKVTEYIPSIEYLKTEGKIPTNATRPAPKSSINWGQIVAECEAYIDSVEKGEGDDRLSDYRHFLYEAVMKTVYGDEVFKYFREFD